jgi:hypothetical protein
MSLVKLQFKVFDTDAGARINRLGNEGVAADNGIMTDYGISAEYGCARINRDIVLNVWKARRL